MIRNTDMLGRAVVLPSLPQRIISLVPSQTETLYDLGVGERVVGCTKFCVHPEGVRQRSVVVGGTKQVHMDRIDALQPDLILGNKEENERDMIDTLAKRYPVWMSDIYTLSDALYMIRALGELTGTSMAATEIADRIARSFSAWRSHVNVCRRRVLYIIWHKPWMAVGKNTFIHTMLEEAGYENALQEQMRYPELTTQAIQSYAPDIILLSSEPYPFKERHCRALAKELKHTAVALVDGELFSWYGSRLLHAVPYFERLRTELDGLQTKKTFAD
jgi:ABC-type Fe3+-hydroxamate transport system substrate-binding protein